MEELPRVIFLNGEINSKTATDCIARLIDYDSRDPGKEISLYINSPGGSIVDGLAIYDTMKCIKSPVSTICYGMAASMGAFLLSCGEKGKRCALPHSRVLIHQPLIYLKNPQVQYQTDMQKMANDIENSRKELESIMASNTSKSIEVIHNDCERDNWMSAEEALTYGLIDKVINK